MELVAGLIGAALVGAGASAYSSHKANSSNKKLFMSSREYNSPVQQMARLREAGLNPNLAYGSVDTGNMAASYHENPIDTSSLSRLGDAFLQYQDIRQKDAMTQQIEAQTEHLESQTDLTDAQAFAQEMDNNYNLANGLTRNASYPEKVVTGVKNVVKNTVPTFEWDNETDFGPDTPAVDRFNADDVWNAMYPGSKGRGPFKGRPMYFKHDYYGATGQW